jgi:hypothetical protein
VHDGSAIGTLVVVVMMPLSQAMDDGEFDSGGGDSGGSSGGVGGDGGGRESDGGGRESDGGVGGGRGNDSDERQR